MKRCPNCNQTFSDENSFCLSDGTVLVSDAADMPTIIRPSPFFQQPVQSVQQGVNPLFAYLAIALFALVAGGVIVAYLKSDSNAPANFSAQPKSETPITASNNVGQNNVASKEPTNDRNVEVVQSSDPKPQVLTTEAVRNLLAVWKQAQENKSFSTYQACYDSSFVGVKTIKTGQSQTLSYRAWMTDRRRMIANAVNLNLDVSNLQIRIEGDTAVAEFDQYYRSLRYSDWGPKEIRVKMTSSGAKIVYEVLKASYPL
jgi:hypothetical protein